MSNTKNKKGKQSEGRKIIKFILGMIAIFAAGYVLGFGLGFAEDIWKNPEFFKDLESIYTKAVPVLFIGLNAIVLAVGLVIYAKAKKMAENWDGEEEDVFDSIEKRLNAITVACNITTVCNIFLVSALYDIADISEAAGADLPAIGFATVGYVIVFAATIGLGKLVMDIEKQLNPRRQAVSVFDFDAEKKWEESSDEAQKQMMYKAAYAAYKMVNKACSIMWIVAFCADLVLDTGLFPIACICIIWGTLIGTYSIVSAKLETGVITDIH